MYEVFTMVMLLWLNKNVWLIYVVLRQRLIKTPGQYNQTIGQTFLKLIDEAFRHYRLWQNDKDRPGYGAWATLFKDKIRIALEQWRDKAGYIAVETVAKPPTKSTAMVVFSG